MIGLPVEFTMPSGFNRGSTPNDTPYCGIVNAELFGVLLSARRHGCERLPGNGFHVRACFSPVGIAGAGRFSGRCEKFRHISSAPYSTTLADRGGFSRL